MLTDFFFFAISLSKSILQQLGFRDAAKQLLTSRISAPKIEENNSSWLYNTAIKTVIEQKSLKTDQISVEKQVKIDC